MLPRVFWCSFLELHAVVAIGKKIQEGKPELGENVILPSTLVIMLLVIVSVL